MTDPENLSRVADTIGKSDSLRREAVPEQRECFHCGEPCASHAYSAAGKSFCCMGCRTVYNLLLENGLGQFYELGQAPGSQVNGTTQRESWTFLDDPAVREKLLDFADTRQAKVTLHLPAIHCVACVWLLENLFRLHAGIGKSLVNFARQWDPLESTCRHASLSIL